MAPPSNFALRIIVEKDSKLVRALNAKYADGAPDGGLHPGERDALFDVQGLHFTGSLWPRSGGMDDEAATNGTRIPHSVGAARGRG
jgi:hypothetical protein